MEPDNRNWYYDYRIEIDRTKLPKKLLEAIEGMEKADLEGDDIKYDYYLKILDIHGKAAIRDGMISEKTYDLLMRKYAWYV